MALSSEHAARVQAHLAERGARCPVCGGARLEPTETALVPVAAPDDWGPPNASLRPNGTYPAIVVECADCAAIIWIARRPVLGFERQAGLTG